MIKALETAGFCRGDIRRHLSAIRVITGWGSKRRQGPAEGGRIRLIIKNKKQCRRKRICAGKNKEVNLW